MAAIPPILNAGFWEITVPGNIVWMMTTMTTLTTPNTSDPYKVINPIDMTGYTALNTLQSICGGAVVNAPAFLGTFDGQGFEIKINLPDVNTSTYYGLFGIVGNNAVSPVIQGVNLVYTGNTFSYTPSPLPATVSYLGSLVGYSNKATINNCDITYNNDVIITHSLGTNTTLQQYTGGICGKIENVSILTNSDITFKGTAKILHSGTATSGSISAIRAIGGVCGYVGVIPTTVPTIITNTLQICKMYINKDTTLGSESTNPLQLVSKIGGICGGAAGDVILDGCEVLEEDTAIGGALIIRNSGNDTPVGSAECSGAVLIGELRQEALFSLNRKIMNCQFSLTKFDISIRIGVIGGVTPGALGCFIGKVVDTLVQVDANKPIKYIDNIDGLAKTITLYCKTNGNSSTLFYIGGMFGLLGQANNMVNVSNCSLTTIGNYTVDFIVVPFIGTGLPNLYYGGITSGINLGAVPTSITNPATDINYRRCADCLLTIGGNTTITMSHTLTTAIQFANASNMGGLFGQIRGGNRTTPSPTVLYPFLIDNCDATYSGNFTLNYNSSSSTTTASPSATNQLFLGGFIGNTQGCNVTNCNNIFGSTNNTLRIAADIKAAYSCYMSCGIGEITTLQNGTAFIPSFILGCTIKVNGNVELINDNGTVNSPTLTARQCWNGGLIARILNGAECSSTTLEITGTYTSTAKSTGIPTSTSFLQDAVLMGGLVGEITGAILATSPPSIFTSKLLSCTGTVSGNTIFNANENSNFQAQIGGIIGRVNGYATLNQTTMTYRGTSTLTSINTTGLSGAPGPGARFIGGIVGLSSGTVTALKTITNSTVTIIGDTTMITNSSSSLPPSPNPPNFPTNAADGVIGGLFGRIADGTTCSGCNGIFNSKLLITNGGTLSGTNTSIKNTGGLCGQVLNSGGTGALPVTLTNSTIQVDSTTELISNAIVITSNTRCGILFGSVQDASPDFGTSVSGCTGTFNDKVTLNVNNTSTGGMYMGGIVGLNIRAQIISTTLNLRNGVEIDNKSATNTFCYAGLIVGESATAATNNIAEIIDSTVNITGNALIDTNSTTALSVIGSLAAIIDSRFENNTINGENCIFTLNVSSTNDATFGGGLIGVVTNSLLNPYNVSNNILKARTLNITTSSPTPPLTDSSYIAGVIGRINTSNITVTNNQVLVYDTTSLTNSNANQTNNMALVFAGIEGGANTVTNNIFLTVNRITIIGSNSPQPTVIRINSVTASNTSSGTTPTNNFSYICNISSDTLLNFQSYPTGDADGLTIYGTNYPITSKYIVPDVYTIDILPAITVLINCIIPPPPFVDNTPPCCRANVCDANPQAANYDNQVVVSNKGGQVLVAAVNDFYAAAAAGQGRPNAPPIFKTYLQMMEWKQRQNRR